MSKRGRGCLVPELPEVETIVRELTPYVVGQTIQAVRVSWSHAVAWPESAEAFCVGLQGRRIDRTGRRAKFALFYLDDGQILVVHLRMSGQLLLSLAGRPAHLRASWEWAGGGGLYFYDQRKFGRLWLVGDLEQATGHLGPEPLDESLTADDWVALFQRRRGRLKPLLLDQRFIAGLGNIYADESLFLAGLHPLRRVETLAPDEVIRLREAVQAVLRQALAQHGTSFDGVFVRPEGEQGRQQEGLRVYQQTGLPCVRCGAPIQRIMVGGRGTHLCLRCQPLSK